MTKMKSLFAALGAVLLAGSIGWSSQAEAAGFPENKPREQEWSFAGPFGTWDLGQLQRGFKVYKEVCASCHSMDLVAFRNLTEIGFSEEEVKAIAAEYEVQDGPNADGEMFDRTAVPSDRWPSPWANAAEAAAANNGAAPPDFSLLAKARAPERGFPTFIFDIFTMYAENGPDYIHSLLTGYQEPKDGEEAPEGLYYNPYFASANYIAMAPPLDDDLVEYDDGTPATLEQLSKDVSAFMMWAAEPMLVERKQLGFKVMLFLTLFAILLYFSKKQVFAGLKSGPAPSAGSARLATAAAGAGSAGSAPKPKAATAARTSTAPASSGTASLTAGVDYIDDIELIDGIGATIAKRLKAEGVSSLVTIANMSTSEIASVAQKVNAGQRYVREEWQAQARDLISGVPPRAKVDQLRVAKLLGKK